MLQYLATDYKVGTVCTNRGDFKNVLSFKGDARRINCRFSIFEGNVGNVGGKNRGICFCQGDFDNIAFTAPNFQYPRWIDLT